MKRKMVGLLLVVFCMTLLFSENVFAASKPYYCYTLSDGNVTVYKTATLKTKYGTIYGSSDEVQVLSVSGNAWKVKYPVTNKSGKITGYKTGYVSKSAITKGNITSSNAITAKKKITTYKKSNGKSTYGYIAVGDKVYLMATSGSYTQVAYPISNGYKIAWVKSSELKDDGGNTTTDKVSSTNKYTQLLDKMMKGSAYNGAYKLNTRYRGSYWKEQCKGFAKSVHEKLFGYNIGSTKGKPYNYLLNYSSSKTKYLGSVTSMTESNVKNLFLKARPGDFVQIRRRHGGSHSAIIYSVSQTSVTFYEANIDGKNGIVKKTYKWSDLNRSNAAMSLYTAKKY